MRDEHGMQPLDDIFSSPDRESQAGGAGANGQDASEEESEDEESMDIDEGQFFSPQQIDSLHLWAFALLRN